MSTQTVHATLQSKPDGQALLVLIRRQDRADGVDFGPPTRCMVSSAQEALEEASRFAGDRPVVWKIVN